MRYAVVCSACGHVVSVLEQDDIAELVPPEGHELIEDPQAQAGPGSHWDSTAFSYAPQVELRQDQ